MVDGRVERGAVTEEQIKRWADGGGQAGRVVRGSDVHRHARTARTDVLRVADLSKPELTTAREDGSAYDRDKLRI